MTDQAERRAINRARHLALLRQARLELWRIRGQAARAAGMPRELPRIPGAYANQQAQNEAAWLAGYDGVTFQTLQQNSRQQPASAVGLLAGYLRAGGKLPRDPAVYGERLTAFTTATPSPERTRAMTDRTSPAPIGDALHRAIISAFDEGFKRDMAEADHVRAEIKQRGTYWAGDEIWKLRRQVASLRKQLDRASTERS